MVAAAIPAVGTGSFSRGATTSTNDVAIVRCESAIVLARPAAPTSQDRLLFDRVWFVGRDRVPSPNPQPFGSGPFVYYAKTGFNVRRGRVGALVEVPAAWRSRVRITWGNVASASRIRFLACRSGPTWITYAGGFLFRDKRGGCVPLRITVESSTKTVSFSAGRHC